MRIGLWLLLWMLLAASVREALRGDWTLMIVLGTALWVTGDFRSTPKCREKR